VCFSIRTPGQAGVAEIADLIRLLRSRLRRWIGAEHVGQEWADAIAAFSVAAPILMSAYLAPRPYVFFRFVQLITRFASFSDLAEHFIITVALSAMLLMLAALTVYAALAGRRRRLGVALILTVHVLLGTAVAVYLDLIGFGRVAVGFIALFVTEIAAVVIAPDPGRGRRVLGGKALIFVLAVVAVTLAADKLEQASAFAINQAVVEVAILAIGFALIMIFGSGAHKRLLALLAIPGYPILAYMPIYSLLFAPQNGNVLSRVLYVPMLYVPTLAIALLVALAIWRSSRQGSPPQTTAATKTTG
jgi:hypothetical protein